VLCDTYSVSSSGGFTVTLVRVREHRGATPRRPRVARAPRSFWRLLRGALRTTPATSPADGTVPPANLGDGSRDIGVRYPLPPQDDLLEAMLLFPESMRWTC
jgi:hypothetical protein